jgi:hypothetical protein
MNVTSAYSHAIIAFRGQSDQNNHPTLSRVAQEAGSQVPVTAPISHSPLSAVQLALSNQILLFENVTFRRRQEHFWSSDYVKPS